eukprot:scaffold45361_cov59-Phaeocystis_antarctica.AAC.1
MLYPPPGDAVLTLAVTSSGVPGFCLHRRHVPRSGATMHDLPDAQPGDGDSLGNCMQTKLTADSNVSGDTNVSAIKTDAVLIKPTTIDTGAMSTKPVGGTLAMLTNVDTLKEEPGPSKEKKPGPSKEMKPGPSKEKKPSPSTEKKLGPSKEKKLGPSKEKEPGPSKEKELGPSKEKELG